MKSVLCGVLYWLNIYLTFVGSFVWRMTWVNLSPYTIHHNIDSDRVYAENELNCEKYSIGVQMRIFLMYLVNFDRLDYFSMMLVRMNRELSLYLPTLPRISNLERLVSHIEYQFKISSSTRRHYPNCSE